MEGTKTALITGVSGGIGSAAAKALCEAGYAVTGLDLREPRSPLPGVRFLPVDLTDPGAIEDAAALLAKEGARIDCVVHMAGIYDLNSLVEMPDEAWRRIFDVNLTSVYRVNRAFLPLLAPGARIVITSSELAPLDPLPFTGIYGITKAAIEKYAFSLRMELQLLGMSVTVLRPGAVDTGLLGVSTDRLEQFCRETKLYPNGSRKMRAIVDRVESKKIPPEKIAALLLKILGKRKPPFARSINRNPLLLLMNALPDRMQCFLIRRLLS
ncbi:MAG: SDR family NAD(P)-dependent oxidoreductase [Clostridia bacterium]|nr:SDR family NAD(P)-dependent oxidoreductase [Clostridia bacterium]